MERNVPESFCDIFNATIAGMIRRIMTIEAGTGARVYGDYSCGRVITYLPKCTKSNYA